jgi:hypothetical protein
MRIKASMWFAAFLIGGTLAIAPITSAAEKGGMMEDKGGMMEDAMKDKKGTSKMSGVKMKKDEKMQMDDKMKMEQKKK